MSWAIRHDNGTYYTGTTGIGPRFGGTEQTAVRFTTKINAAREMNHSAFGETTIVRLRKKGTGQVITTGDRVRHVDHPTVVGTVEWIGESKAFVQWDDFDCATHNVSELQRASA